MAILTDSRIGQIETVILKEIKPNQANLEFSDAVNDDLRGTDVVTIQIGTIQFLRRGFSITFDSARLSFVRFRHRAN